MTKSVALCYRLLRPLRLYSLVGGTLVDAELAAYDAGFALAEGGLDELEAESFVQTAAGYGLALREEMMQLWLRPQSGPEKRRELLLHRLSVTPNAYSVAGLTGSVRAAGLNAQVLEDIANGRIRIIEDGYIGDFETVDALKEDVRRMLPAHLEADFEIGNFTWDQFAAADVTCAECDAKDVTWSKLDLDGEAIFGGGNGNAKHA